jgi:hypothetical protein
MSRFEQPSAAIKMMRARLAILASIVPARVQASSTSRSPALNLSGGSRMTTSNHISVIYAVIH